MDKEKVEGICLTGLAAAEVIDEKVLQTERNIEILESIIHLASHCCTRWERVYREAKERVKLLGEIKEAPKEV